MQGTPAPGTARPPAPRSELLAYPRFLLQTAKLGLETLLDRRPGPSSEPDRKDRAVGAVLEERRKPDIGGHGHEHEANYPGCVLEALGPDELVQETAVWATNSLSQPNWTGVIGAGFTELTPFRSPTAPTTSPRL